MFPTLPFPVSLSLLCNGFLGFAFLLDAMSFHRAPSLVWKCMFALLYCFLSRSPLAAIGSPFGCEFFRTAMATFRVCFGCWLFRTGACLPGPQWIPSEGVLGANFSGPPWLQWECVLGAAFSDRLQLLLYYYDDGYTTTPTISSTDCYHYFLSHA